MDKLNTEMPIPPPLMAVELYFAVLEVSNVEDADDTRDVHETLTSSTVHEFSFKFWSSSLIATENRKRTGAIPTCWNGPIPSRTGGQSNEVQYGHIKILFEPEIKEIVNVFEVAS